MKRSKYPWTSRPPEGCDEGCRIIYSLDGEEIACTSGLADDPEDAGNAVLFANAPMMLDLLGWAVALLYGLDQRVVDPLKYSIATDLIRQFEGD